MRNPFLIVRIVFLSLLVYLSLLTIVFSAWNIHVTLSLNLSVEASIGILLANSCVTLILVPCAFAELIFPGLKVQLGFECLAAALLFLFQIGASIGLTAGNFQACHLLDQQTCISSSLLVISSWLFSFTVFTFFLVLFSVTMAHSGTEDQIWSKSAFAIDWFAVHQSSQAQEPKLLENDSWTLYLNKIGSTSSNGANDIEKAPWAQTQIRRGIDPPFIRRDNETASQASSSAPLSVQPLKVEAKGTSSSRFIERLRDSLSLDSPFDSYIDDDKPIPLPRSSAWFKADVLKHKLTAHEKQYR